MKSEGDSTAMTASQIRDRVVLRPGWLLIEHDGVPLVVPAPLIGRLGRYVASGLVMSLAEARRQGIARDCDGAASGSPRHRCSRKSGVAVTDAPARLPTLEAEAGQLAAEAPLRDRRETLPAAPRLERGQDLARRQR